MSSYEFACYLILGGIVIMLLVFIAFYLVNKYRTDSNKKKGD